MKTKEFVKKFEAIMYEPKERFDDVEFKKNHLVPTGIEINDDFSRSYFFDSEVFGIEDEIYKGIRCEYNGFSFTVKL